MISDQKTLKNFTSVKIKSRFSNPTSEIEICILSNFSGPFLQHKKGI